MEFDYIDIHSHLNLSPLTESQEHMLEHMRENNVAAITVGVDLATSRHAVNLAEALELWATVGCHPTDNVTEVFEYEAYKTLAEHPDVVAIGECGLDYYRSQDLEMKQKQEVLFREHVRLAQEVGKPLMIHARPSKGSMDAYEDVLNILEKIPDAPKANFHFFVGNTEIAKRILALGGTMSFDGPITFTSEYDEVIKFIPLESMHAETDAPFAAPAPYRGKTCEPWMVVEVVKKIAAVKGLPLEDVKVQLRKNAQEFFKLK
jgi:TatD DNase family protein